MKVQTGAGPQCITGETNGKGVEVRIENAEKTDSSETEKMKEG